ncbi:hypothetical protein, partial [Deinococcus pimensis]|uniref:hypothetical protein n=1 Tax=Deinococcus pimensis TaxID=309888 RepID=UPI0005EB5EA2
MTSSLFSLLQDRMEQLDAFLGVRERLGRLAFLSEEHVALVLLCAAAALDMDAASALRNAPETLGSPFVTPAVAGRVLGLEPVPARWFGAGSPLVRLGLLEGVDVDVPEAARPFRVSSRLLHLLLHGDDIPPGEVEPGLSGWWALPEGEVTASQAALLEGLVREEAPHV